MALHRRCDHCERPATYHAVEISKDEKSKKIEKHLCDDCAAEQGLAPGGGQLQHLLGAAPSAESQASQEEEAPERVCDHCGLRFSALQAHNLLGCPQCYEAFAAHLEPLLQRAHEGASSHLGKVPRRAGQGEARQKELMRLRKQLAEAVANESFEQAARLRDEVRRYEEPTE
jgi:protein arginine kinase activator